VKKQKRNLIIAASTLLIIAVGLGALAWSGFFTLKPQPFTPHYIQYKGTESGIYTLSEATVFTTTDHTLTSANGVSVPKGTPIFAINITLRNDYSTQNPPPANGAPVAPADGTAYIRLKATLLKNDASITAVNISPSDFASPPDQTGLVLISGQTLSTQLLLATNQTDITAYSLSLEYVGDSIPTS
jgi:hypothetical protein